MTKPYQMILLYLMSGEESRLGRKDYWNHVYLSRITPQKGKFLESLKTLLVIIFSVIMTATITLL